MDDLKFFIVVPVYKTEKYISKCIDSVLNQTYQNFQIILVDDGSPDRSGEICDQYAKIDSRIKVIHQKNQGTFGARRTAIKYILVESTSDDYVMFLDSDDTFKNNALAVVSKTILDTQAELVMFRWESIYTKRNLLHFRKHQEIIFDKKQLYKRVFSSDQYSSLCFKAASVKLFDDGDYQKFYGIEYSEDLIQSIPLFKSCNFVVFIEDQLYNYTFNQDSATQRNDVGKYVIDNSVVREIVIKFLKEENVWSELEWKEYLLFCGKQLSYIIERIGRMNCSYNKKIYYFDQILQNQYYSMVINHNNKRHFIRLIQKRWHAMLFLECKIISFLSNVYHVHHNLLKRWKCNE